MNESEDVHTHMDLQLTLEKYSCASYVLDHINKTNCGFSKLRRCLVNLQDEYPDRDYTELQRVWRRSHERWKNGPVSYAEKYQIAFAMVLLTAVFTRFFHPHSCAPRSSGNIGLPGLR